MAKLSTRTFGVEFELYFTSEGWDQFENDYSKYIVDDYGNGHPNYEFMRAFLRGNKFNNWKVTSDSSIESDDSYQEMEVITPILQGAYGLKEIIRFCNLLKPYASVNESTGLHVHVGASDFVNQNNAAERLTMALLQYGNVDAVFDSLVMAHRRGNEERHALNSGTTEEILEKYRTIVTEQGNTLDSMIRILQNSRYRKINLHALQKHGTIEFRQMHGTLNPEIVKNWVIICMAFLDSIASTESVFLSLLQELRTKITTKINSNQNALNAESKIATYRQIFLVLRTYLERTRNGQIKGYKEHAELIKAINGRYVADMLSEVIPNANIGADETIGGESYFTVSIPVEEFSRMFIDKNATKWLPEMFQVIREENPVASSRFIFELASGLVVLKIMQSYGYLVGSQKGTLNKYPLEQSEMQPAQNALRQTDVSLPQRNINKLQAQTNKSPLREVKK